MSPPVAAHFTFQQAKAFMMPFGKYAGMELDAIAADDRGLLYLDYLRGADWMQTRAKEHIIRAINAYLSDPTIAKDLLIAMQARPRD